MSSYLSELNSIVKKLKDLGTELAEETISAKVINDLPREYETFSTPYELWHGKSPQYDHLKVFGCDAYVLVPEGLRRKWDSEAQKLIFVGYTDTTKNYRLYDPIKHGVIVAKHVKFDKNSMIPDRAQILENTAIVNHIAISDSDEEPNHPTDVSTQQPPRLTNNDIDIPPLSTDSLTQSHKRYNLRDRSSLPVPRYLLMSVVMEPNTFEEALQCPDREKWLSSMEEEMSSLKENKVFELTPLPPSKQAIKCRWVYRIKYLADGTVDRYKSRLVAKGFLQRPGTDFNETFSPVMRYDSMRLILSIASIYKMEIKQFDVTTAFLYGKLDEELYMEQPPDFQDGTNNVCRLLKGLYGLKQAPR